MGRFRLPLGSLPLSFKVKLSAYFLLLTLVPLAAAFGGFGTVLARSETRTVDAQLQAGLRAGTSRYAEEVAWTDELAKDLAGNTGVRRALAERDVQALELVTRTSSLVRIEASGEALRVGRVFPGAIERSAPVFGSDGQVLGRVTASLPIDNALTMLAPDGMIAITGIPWARMRFAYSRGDMTGGKRSSLPGAILRFGNELARRGLGEWYDFPDSSRLAARHGLRSAFYGSIHYPYRFHAVLRR